VFDPKAMHELFPEMAKDPKSDQHWTRKFQEEQGSFATPVQHDKMLLLTNATSSFALPQFLLPPQLHNHGNYVISLSQMCRWLAKRAEELGVEIYPGFSASEVVFWDHNDNDKKIVKGVATRDVGIDKHGDIKPTFARGVELHARQTLFAEGARGSCSEFLMQHFQLRTNCQPQSYGLGLKEVWEVPPNVFQPGFVQHTLGFPLQSGFTDKVFGGSFLYHQEPNLVLIGLVVGLDYANPYLNPYQEFQRWKTHPEVRKHLEGGTCISYGGRVLNEGGFHAIPKCTFPGGALIGCSAGFLNGVKIKGSHTAMKSGMLAAESIFTALTTTNTDSEIPAVAETGELPEPPSEPQKAEVTQYTQALSKSWVYDELHQVRNSHEAFSRWGVGGGVMYTGLTTHITKGREPWTLTHTTTDAKRTKPAQNYQPIVYPPTDGKLTFDLLTNLQRSGTYHEEDQPAHLRIKPELANIPEDVSLQVYGAPEARFCPAAVYEYVEQTDDNKSSSGTGPPKKKLVINAQVRALAVVTVQSQLLGVMMMDILSLLLMLFVQFLELHSLQVLQYQMPRRIYSMDRP
jgi:electron-transferring-flavoprotein dehydrogenase